ncbi:aldo/keto reductase [Rhodoplanes sp. Z2-YC6860]|uniref:aldo/keto reductase n=1 Tax=Rhodoplanes sp. Z2-YC6860 TaxID=674703 RepID=UPI00078D7B83|nr:aldo/keto reductase [Rhodoplanes sp. Z2-YC6860]AMN43834.1 aldo/keto reductase [Rhodoplanes sp. Z2-YC6860]
METRKLGNSNIEVSVVGIGCNNFGRRIHDVSAARAVVDRAIDLGITLFDTADVYGNGTSESFLGETIGKRRSQVVIATKFGWGSPSGASRRTIARTVEASLKRLRSDYIDLYQVHYPDPNTPIEETLRALDDLIRDGKVRAIGCSNFSSGQVSAALDTSARIDSAAFVTCQDEYSLLVRKIERDLMPLMLKRGMTLLPYAPLAGGFLSGKYLRGRPLPKDARLAYSSHHATDVINERNWNMADKLRDFAERTGRSMLNIAFGWLLARPVTASVIAGAMTPEQVELNVRAGNARLSADDVAELDRITK